MHDASQRTTRATRRCSCRFHCSDCGRHFTSIKAFEMHRQGSFDAPRLSLDGRRCVNPEHDERERYEQVPGVCGMYAKTERATVWRLAEATEKARRHFGTQDTPELAVAA